MFLINTCNDAWCLRGEISAREEGNSNIKKSEGRKTRVEGYQSREKEGRKEGKEGEGRPATIRINFGESRECEGVGEKLAGSWVMNILLAATPTMGDPSVGASLDGLLESDTALHPLPLTLTPYSLQN